MSTNPTEGMDPEMKELYALLQKWMLNVIETLEYLTTAVNRLDKAVAEFRQTQSDAGAERAKDDGVNYEVVT